MSPKHVQNLKAAWENPYQYSCRQTTHPLNLRWPNKHNPKQFHYATCFLSNPIWTHGCTHMQCLTRDNDNLKIRSEQERFLLLQPKRHTSISFHLNPSGAGRLSQHWWSWKPNEEAFDRVSVRWTKFSLIIGGFFFAKLSSQSSKLKQAWWLLYSYSDSGLVITTKSIRDINWNLNVNVTSPRR